MELEVLLSSVGVSDHEELLGRANISGAAILVDQNDHHDRTRVLSEKPRWLLLQRTDRGLSRSRNVAMDASRADVCVLADDDEVFLGAYEDRILSAFQQRPRADVIAFSVQDEDRIRKRPLASKGLMRHQLMKVSSVQIAFRRKSVVESRVRFDERFGAGAPFRMGEELIFLSDLHRSGLRIEAVPLEIAMLRPSDSTWFTGYDKGFFESRGASFYRADRLRFYANTMQWAVRKRALFSTDVTIPTALRWMIGGGALLRSAGRDMGARE